MSNEFDAAVAGTLGQQPAQDTTADPFDAAVAGVLRPDQGQAARAGFVLASDTDPDAYAEAQRVARRANLPIETVLNQPKEAKRQDTIGAIDFDTLGKTSPATAALLADVEKAKIAHDNVDNMTGIESVLSSLGTAVKYLVSAPDQKNTLMGDIGAGFAQANRGAAGLFQSVFELPNNLVGTILPANPLQPVADQFAQWGAQSKDLAKRLSPPQSDTLGSGVSSGVQSLTSNLLMLPLALLPGGQPAALGGMASMTGGQSYQDARSQGLTPAQALPFAVSQATIEYATEKLPVSRLIGDLHAGSPLLKTLAHQVATEVPGEQVATVLQDLNEWAVLPENKDKPFSAYLAERPSAAAQTLIATLVGVGGNVAVMRGIDRTITTADQRTQRAQAAQQQAELLARLNQLAAADKVLARDPDTFEQFVANAAENGPVQQVFIDANTLMQSGLAEQVAAVSPAVAAQLPEALQTGGQVAIPVEEYAARIAPTEAAQGLLDHLKTEPEGFSRAEAQQYMQSQAEELRAEVERALGEQQGDDAFKQSAEAVRAAVKTQLDTAARFTPQVNDAYSSMVGNFYAVQAARLGTTPEALFQQYPLRVAAESVAGGQQFDQEHGPFGPVLRDFQGDAKGAIAKLLEMKSGEAIGALHHSDIGDIDLVWGEEGTRRSDGYGLAKLAKWHPEVLDDLQGILSAMKVTSRTENRVNLESADHRAGVRLTWDDQAKHWLLTAFQKKGGVAGTRTGTTDLFVEDGTARPDDASDAIVDQKIDKFYQGGGRARGTFDPATLTVSLLKNADLSTFLHESGHFFLEVQLDIATRLAEKQRAGATLIDAETEVQRDAQTLLDWFGVRDLAAWNDLDFEAKRAHHEQFARGFEAYLFEGKAPSIEMHGLFQRFRAWLLNVYRDLKALNVELTPEVRNVFDRMLATGEQIALAEQGRSMMPLFATAEQAGMTPEEFAAYQALGVDATNDAIQDLQARGLRDMQWLHNARGRIIKQLQKDAAARRADVRRQVAEEVNAQPVYRADRFLRYGELELPPGAPQNVRRAAEQANVDGAKLSLPALKEMYGEGENAIWRYLPTGKNGLAASEGMHPDTVAELFGFTSGDELVRRLLEAPPRGEEIEALTDVRMLEQFGELSTPEAIERAADSAIHNDARARFVATEANALARAAAGPTQQIGTDRRGRPIVRRVLPEAAREYARALVSRLKVRDIRPGQYTNAEVRAARNADRAMKAGDLATAAAEKRNQLIQHQAARAAYDAQDEVERGLRYLGKFAGDIKGIDVDYADQIANLLERFDLRKGQSLKAVDKRTALADWLRSQREAGFEPDIPAELENEAYRTSYKNMTVEEFRGLVDSVRQIEHLGRLKRKLLTAADQRDYEAVRDEIAGSIRAHAQGRSADTRTPTTNAGRAVQGLKRFWASHIKAATWARVMDGGKDGGPMWEYFVRSANERGDMETTMRAEATGKLSEILAPVFALGKMGGKGQHFPTIGRSLNREARLTIALNMGNEGNIQRLLGGEGWTPAQIAPVLQSLTAQEWQAVQAVWDHFEGYRPQIAAKERRVYGKEPAWVEPRPLTITTADGQTLTLRGGYYPIKYDPAASQRAEEHSDAESARRQLQGAYTTATTRRSFTKSRVEEVSGRPLLYTLSGLYSGVNDVIHDLAWHEWLIDANRLLRSQTIDGAIREHYGPEAKQQFKTWAADIAEGERGADAAVDIALSRLRQGVSASGLGFNVMSALMQPLGITQSIVRVGAPWVGRGVMKYLAAPVGLTREINAKSSFMANRARTRFRELNELRNQVQDGSATKEWVGRNAYFLMMRCQQMVDVPTWWGAYEKAVAEGNDETRAVSLADQAVIDSQGGGQTKDLSAIERGGPAQRLFTVFYSFMNTALNIGVAQTMSADTPAKRAKLAADYAMLYVVPAVLGYFLKDALTPGDSGDDDPEKLAKKLLANQIDYLMGLMVVVREFGEAAKTVTGANDMGRDYTGPAGLRLIADVGRFATQTHQGEFDDAFRKAAVNVVGDLFGLPSAQINRTVTGVQALAEGKTQNPAAIGFGFQEAR
ncbi:hypothetical protein WLZ18_03005 [Bordetella bronchiseptica]